MFAADLRPGRTDHVVELAYFAPRVVSGAAAFNVQVVGTAVELEVSDSRNVTGLGVISDLVGANIKLTELDVNVSVQPVHVADFFLLVSRDRTLFRRSRLHWTQLAGY